MAIPLRLGRTLTDSDNADAPKVAVLSEALARKHFANGNPIGRRLRIGAPDGPWFTVVGVVGDIKHASLAAPLTDAVYVSGGQWLWAESARSLTLRYRGEADEVVSQMRQAIWSVDGERPISRVATMQQLMSIGATDRRFASAIFSAFGIAALLLAAMGIYSALSVSVAERSSEIGLRMALGARASLVLRWVLTQAISLIGLGVVLGLLLASGTTVALQSLLFGVTATDPATFALAALLLATIGLLACIAPLRRALAVEPAQALRWE